VVKDERGRTAAKKPYLLEVDGLITEGETDGDGLLESPIPATATEGRLRLWWGEDTSPGSAHEILLKIGQLEPTERLRGIQARLNNLGFRCGSVDGVPNPATEAALRDFQQRHGLDVTGQADAATSRKLEQLHDHREAR
jgi:hypothetical protein